MEYGNSGAEFNWSYMGGQGAQGGQGGQAAHSAQGMSAYPQMGQMSPGGYGGGQQWVHSNQANTQSYQQSMSPNMSQTSPYESYNQSMMRYTNIPKSGGGGMDQMGMNPMGGSYGGYGGGMARNGLAGNAGAGMGQGGNSGYSSW